MSDDLLDVFSMGIGAIVPPVAFESALLYVRAVCQLYASGVIPEGISESVISDLVGVHYALSTEVEGHQEKPLSF